MGSPKLLTIDPETLASLHRLLTANATAVRLDRDFIGAASSASDESVSAPTIEPRV